MTNPGTPAGLLPRTEDWIAREILSLRRQMRHRPLLWRETFTYPGTLAVASGLAQVYNHEGLPLTIISVRAQVVTAPVGAAIIIDLLKNGTSIYTTTANRPTIAAGTTSVVAVLPDDVAFLDGDYLSPQIVQVGSTTAGTTLTLQVRAA